MIEYYEPRSIFKYHSQLTEISVLSCWERVHSTCGQVDTVTRMIGVGWHHWWSRWTRNQNIKDGIFLGSIMLECLVHPWLLELGKYRRTVRQSEFVWVRGSRDRNDQGWSRWWCVCWYAKDECTGHSKFVVLRLNWWLAVWDTWCKSHNRHLRCEPSHVHMGKCPFPVYTHTSMQRTPLTGSQIFPVPIPSPIRLFASNTSILVFDVMIHVHAALPQLTCERKYS